METLAVDLGRAIDLEIWHLEPEDGFYGPPPERVCRIMPQLLLTHLLTQALSEQAEHHCPVCGRTFNLIYCNMPNGWLFTVRTTPGGAVEIREVTGAFWREPEAPPVPGEARYETPPRPPRRERRV